MIRNVLSHTCTGENETRIWLSDNINNIEVISICRERDYFTIFYKRKAN